MTQAEINEELRLLDLDQLKQEAIMADSDAHSNKCQKLKLDFEETYPEEYAAYVAANAKWHQNAERIEELKAMVPEDEPQEHSEYPESEE